MDFKRSYLKSIMAITLATVTIASSTTPAYAGARASQMVHTSEAGSTKSNKSSSKNKNTSSKNKNTSSKNKSSSKQKGKKIGNMYDSPNVSKVKVYHSKNSGKGTTTTYYGKNSNVTSKSLAKNKANSKSTSSSSSKSTGSSSSYKSTSSSSTKKNYKTTNINTSNLAASKNDSDVAKRAKREIQEHIGSLNAGTHSGNIGFTDDVKEYLGSGYDDFVKAFERNYNARQDLAVSQGKKNTPSYAYSQSPSDVANSSKSKSQSNLSSTYNYGTSSSSSTSSSSLSSYKAPTISTSSLAPNKNDSEVAKRAKREIQEHIGSLNAGTHSGNIGFTDDVKEYLGSGYDDFVKAFERNYNARQDLAVSQGKKNTPSYAYSQSPSDVANSSKSKSHSTSNTSSSTSSSIANYTVPNISTSSLAPNKNDSEVAKRAKREIQEHIGSLNAGTHSGNIGFTDDVKEYLGSGYDDFVKAFERNYNARQDLAVSQGKKNTPSYAYSQSPSDVANSSKSKSHSTSNTSSSTSSSIANYTVPNISTSSLAPNKNDSEVAKRAKREIQEHIGSLNAGTHSGNIGFTDDVKEYLGSGYDDFVNAFERNYNARQDLAVKQGKIEEPKYAYFDRPKDIALKSKINRKSYERTKNADKELHQKAKDQMESAVAALENGTYDGNFKFSDDVKQYLGKDLDRFNKALDENYEIRKEFKKKTGQTYQEYLEERQRPQIEYKVTTANEPTIRLSRAQRELKDHIDALNRGTHNGDFNFTQDVKDYAGDNYDELVKQFEDFYADMKKWEKKHNVKKPTYKELYDPSEVVKIINKKQPVYDQYGNKNFSIKKIDDNTEEITLGVGDYDKAVEWLQRRHGVTDKKPLGYRLLSRVPYVNIGSESYYALKMNDYLIEKAILDLAYDSNDGKEGIKLISRKGQYPGDLQSILDYELQNGTKINKLKALNPIYSKDAALNLLNGATVLIDKEQYEDLYNAVNNTKFVVSTVDTLSDAYDDGDIIKFAKGSYKILDKADDGIEGHETVNKVLDGISLAKDLKEVVDPIYDEFTRTELEQEYTFWVNSPKRNNPDLVIGEPPLEEETVTLENKKYNSNNSVAVSSKPKVMNYNNTKSNKVKVNNYSDSSKNSESNIKVNNYNTQKSTPVIKSEQINNYSETKASAPQVNNYSAPKTTSPKVNNYSDSVNDKKDIVKVEGNGTTTYVDYSELNKNSKPINVNNYNQPSQPAAAPQLENSSPSSQGLKVMDYSTPSNDLEVNNYNN